MRTGLWGVLLSTGRFTLAARKERYRAATVRESVPVWFRLRRVRERPTKVHEDAQWGGPPGPRGPLGPAAWRSITFPSGRRGRRLRTRGVRPTWRLQRS